MMQVEIYTNCRVQGSHLNPMGFILRTSIPFMWRILSAFLVMATELVGSWRRE